MASSAVIVPSLSFFLLMAERCAQEKSLPWLLLATQKLNFPSKLKEEDDKLSFRCQRLRVC